MYKVLRREDGKLVSCVIGYRETEIGLKKWELTYYPHRWKKAKIGKIILCKTLKDAIETSRIQQGDEIWRCQTKGAIHLKRLAHLSGENFERFWNDRYLSSYMYFAHVPPVYGADRIKLTKKVWPK